MQAASVLGDPQPGGEQPAPSVELTPEEHAAARAARRKRKKALKQLSAGRLTSAAAGSLLTPSDLAGAITAAAGFHLTAEKSGRRVDAVSVADVQQLVLWMFAEAAAPQWISVRNRALVGSTVVLIVRGSNHAQLLAAVAAGAAPHVGALAAMPARIPRSRSWGRERKELLDIDGPLLYISNTSVRERLGGAVGSGERRVGADAAATVAAAPTVAVARGKRRRASDAAPEELPHASELVFELCLRVEELAAHDFPLPLLRREAAAAASSSCELQLGPGFAMTRTAALDLHNRGPAVDTATAQLPSSPPHRFGCRDSGCAAATATSEAPQPRRIRCGLPRLVAVDCEMCTTAVGPQVARVTAVDARGAVLLDELVRPSLPVLDHLTQFSGVTARMLAGATASFEEVRRRLVDILDGVAPAGGGGGADAAAAPQQHLLQPAIAVGHSLECDLQALRLVHTRVLDTSLAFPNPRGLPARHALRHLALRELGRVIQSGHGSTGHDSVEDTRAAMDLVTHALLADVTAPGDGEEEEGAEGAAVGGSHAAAAAPCSHPPFHRTLFSAPRAHLLPPPPTPDASPDDNGAPSHAEEAGAGHGGEQQQRGQADTESGAVAAGRSTVPRGSYGLARGVAGLVGLMGAPPALAPQPLRQPQPAPTPPSRGPGAPLLGLAALSDRAVCGAASLIGSPTFLRAHLAGSASGVSLPAAPGASAPDARRVLARASDEVRRFAAGRRDGRWGGPGLVVAELALPTATRGAAAVPAAPDWAAFDALWAEWLTALPPNTAVIAVTQEAHAGGGGRGRGAAVDEATLETALWGTALFCCSGGSSAAAAGAPAVASQLAATET